jgi:hypothetical protein
VYIINSEGIAYHQHEVLYIIKPQGINARWRVMRYKGGTPPLMIYTTLRAAMICQAEAAWIKKFSFEEREFFGLPDRI